MYFLGRLILLGACGLVVGFKPFDKFEPFDDGNNFNFDPFSIDYQIRPLKFYKNNSGKSVNETAELEQQRLPRNAEIQSYDLFIHPHFLLKNVKPSKEKFTFDANATIHFKITTNTTCKFYFFASTELTINVKNTILLEDGKKLEIKKLEINQNKSSFVEIKGKFLDNKNYQLSFTYSGRIHPSTAENPADGLFYNEYKVGNETRYLVATQFEPTHAREVFPSADDPFFKSVFNLAVVYPKSAKIFANTEKKNDTEFDENNRVAQFQQTPKMSTYLLAFAIGDYEIHTTKDSFSNGPVDTKLSIISLKDGSNKDGVAKSLGYAKSCFDFFKNKFPMSHYGLNKLDHINVLSFGAGAAMENWGLITYGDNSLSFVPHQTDVNQVFYVHNVICHETAHQWFGNLVTTGRWGQEFLHESFANFFQNHALIDDKTGADNRLAEQFIRSNRNLGFRAFDLNKHPVITETAKFDHITYEAGGAILRMIKAAIGEDTFYRALQIYLTNNDHNSALYEQLIKAFDQANENKPLCGDLTISQFFDDFFHSPAYPKVSVSIVRKETKNEFNLVQSSSDGNTSLSWNVPLFVRDLKSPNNITGILWLLKDGSTCSNNGLNPKTLNTNVDYDFNASLFSFADVTSSKEIWEKRLKSSLASLDEMTQEDLLIQAVEIKKNPQEEDLKNASSQFVMDFAKKVVESEPKKLSFTLAMVYSTAKDAKKDLISKRLKWSQPNDYDKQFNEFFMIQAIKQKKFTKEALKSFDNFMRKCNKPGIDLFQCNNIPFENHAGTYCYVLLRQKSSPKRFQFYQKYAAEVKAKQNNLLLDTRLEMRIIKLVEDPKYGCLPNE